MFFSKFCEILLHKFNTEDPYAGVFVFLIESDL